MPPDPLSYNRSDVNPHLTQCEPPPYIKAGSAPVQNVFGILASSFRVLLGAIKQRPKTVRHCFNMCGVA